VINENISSKKKLAAGQNIKERDYWLNQLAGEINKSFFPYDNNNFYSNNKKSDVVAHQLNTSKFKISDETSMKLLRMCNNSDHRLHMILVTGWVVLLASYTGNNDITIGTPIYKQNIEGEFINTVLVLRINHELDKSFKELLLHVRDVILEAMENQNYPIESIIYKLNLSTTDSNLRNDFPLFDTAVILHNIHDKEYLHHINRNMTLSFIRDGGNIRFEIEYNPSLYEASTIARIAGHLEKMFRVVLADPGVKLNEIDLLPEEEKKKLLLDFNDTHSQYPEDKTVHELFEKQVARTPDITAVISLSEQLTYRKLNEQSNRLAGLLQDKGTKRVDQLAHHRRDSVIGIVMEPSLEMVIGIIGVLKAGGAYFPIDTAYPIKRILSLLEENKISVVLTKENDFDTEKLEGNKRNILCLDKIEETLVKYPIDNPPLINLPYDLLYLISTSGSTGAPKSLMIEHRNFVNLLNFEFKKTGIPFRKVLQFSSIGFDPSVQEIFSPLLTGGEVYLIEKDMKSDISRLFEYIKTNSINVVFWPPAFLKYIFSEPQYRSEFPSSIEHICAAGEQLVITKPMRQYIKEKGLWIHNFYGPAETHVVTTYTLNPESPIEEQPCIGRPISNTQIYILDEKFRIKPIGVIGELYIGGANVGRGYLNRPELTKEKFCLWQAGDSFYKNRPLHPGKNFLLNDFPTQPLHYSTIYRTGDLARWLPDGNIEFIGRADFQIKIRGFRVELGEIESQIIKTAMVKESAVVDFNDTNGDKYLCAYIVKDTNIQQINIPDIKEALSNLLPDYMIPSYFVEVESIPLTLHGKLDRKSLPQPNKMAIREYTAPRNGVEVKLVDIWHDVLGINAKQRAVGIDDNFFDLGGHSLKATILITKVHKIFNTKLTLGEMFKQPTIRGLAKYIEKSKNEILESIAPMELKTYYPLSSAQKRIYILQQMNLGDMSYNNPASVLLEGNLDVKRMEAELENLMKRHEMLRTSFIEIHGHPVQVISKQANFSVEYGDMRGTDKSGIDMAIKNFIRPFNLKKPPLLRISLLRTGVQKYIFSYDMHHIITDGTSLQVFIKEFMALYQGLVLPPLRIQYKDFSEWQNRMFQKGEIETQEKFWLNRLEGELPVSNIPVDYPRPIVKSFEGSFEVFHIGKEETALLRRLAKEENATLYMLMLTIFNILIAKLSGQEDILVGAPVAGRRHADLQYIIGMFVNTLIMRNYPHGGKPFRDFLGEVRTEALEVLENQEYPFEELVDRLVTNRDTGRNPLVDVVFVFQNMDVSGEEIPEIEIPDLNMYPFNPEQKIKTAKFDLLLVGNESNEGVTLAFEYCTRLFKKETIEKFITFFKTIISTILKNPAKKICEIGIISMEEKEKVLYHFNNTVVEYPREKTVQQIFGEQVESRPECTAITEIPIQITYKELNEKSNHLANELREKGVQSETIVGIIMERSPKMIEAILAILKADGAYLPIDPEYPQERIDFILDDCNAKLSITADKGGDKRNSFIDKNDITRLSLAYCQQKSIKNNRAAGSENCPALTWQPSAHPDKLSYIMYTSGSTGKPKGVMVKHRNIVRLVKNSNFVEFSERLRILQTGAPVFDAVTFEMWGPLLNGGQLFIEKNEIILNAIALNQVLNKYYINTLWLSSPLFNQLVQQKNEIFSTLNYLVVGGDVLSPLYITKIRQKHKDLIVVNGYGPTENTTFSLCHRIHRDYEHNIPIGKPIANSTAYIVDKYQNLQPVGIPGELYLGGDGISRGYLNNPELTTEKFSFNWIKEITSPLSKNAILTKSPTHRLIRSAVYKTGDMARWLPEGIIQFLGRRDNQVKIRGYRVEPNEIEKQLTNHKEIKDAAVIVVNTTKGSESKLLCGYYTANQEIDITELKNHLGCELPTFMIPSYFVHLKVMPLTKNGKLDRQALPAPVVTSLREKTVLPNNAIEKKLVELWSDLLVIEKDRISVGANFFELGGHSLKAAMLASLISKEFNVEFPLREIFNKPTIRELGDIINNLSNNEYDQIKSVECRRYYPQSPAQKRIFFLEQFENIGFSCHIISSLKVEGIIDIKNFTETMKKLVNRHEPLRTSFKVIENEPVQLLHKSVTFNVEYKDFSEDGVETDSEEIIKNFVKPFDLTQPPLLRVGLYKLLEKKHLLLYDIHHIIGDGTSLQVLVEEFMKLFSGEKLLPLPIQYKDFAIWQKDILISKKMEKQEKYWLNLFSGEIPRLNFPTDFPRPKTLSFSGDSYGFQVGAEIASGFREIGMEVGATLYMNLLAVYNVLLYKYSGQNDIIVGTGIMGRPNAALYKMVGMFVNMLAMRNYPSGEKSYLELLKEVSENTLEAFENQDIQFDEIVDKLKIGRDFSQNPLFDVELSLNNFQQARIHQNHRGKLKFEYYNWDNKTSKFDLILYVNEVGENLYCNFRYSTALFKRETIEKISRHFIEILEQVVENQKIRLDEIKLSHEIAMLDSYNLEEDQSDFDF